MSYVLVFIASGTVMVLAGTALARHADAIAEATKLGRLWIGSVLLAGATSLPELTTDISAVRLGATDLAVGDHFGSNAIVYRAKRSFAMIEPSYRHSAGGP